MRGAYLALLGVLYDCTKYIINSIHALEQGISHAQEFFPTTLYILDWMFSMGRQLYTYVKIRWCKVN